MDVDHVYTWVNPDDWELNALRASYACKEVNGHVDYVAGPSRTRDNGELRSSLRLAGIFLPFVRNTYIFGGGEPPSWLSEFGPRVIYVPQNEVIPASIWPTFQSSAIEAYIHQIPDLSEHYIYSNDDFFFARPQTPDDFFDKQGRPRVGLAQRPLGASPYVVQRISEENTIRALIKRMPLPPYEFSLPPLWQDEELLLRRKAIKYWLNLFGRGLPRVNTVAHVSQAFLKSAWIQYNKAFEEELSWLVASKFRSNASIKVNISHHYFAHSLGKTCFYSDVHSRFLDRGASKSARNRLKRDILDPNLRVARFCLNDNPAKQEDGWAEFSAEIWNGLLAAPRPSE